MGAAKNTDVADDVPQATRFVDAKGRVRAILRHGEDGPVLTFYGREGRTKKAVHGFLPISAELLRMLNDPHYHSAIVGSDRHPNLDELMDLRPETFPCAPPDR